LFISESSDELTEFTNGMAIRARDDKISANGIMKHIESIPQGLMNVVNRGDFMIEDGNLIV
jgi:hypothetical protein